MAVVARRHATDESTTMRHLASRDGLHEGAFEVSRSRSAWSAPGMAGWQGMRRRPQFPCHLHGRDRCHGDCRKTGRAAAKATSCGATCRHRVTKMVTWAADGIQLRSPAKSSPWCSMGMAKHRSGRCQNSRRIEAAKSRTIILKEKNQWVSISRPATPWRTKRWRAWRQQRTGWPAASGAVVCAVQHLTRPLNLSSWPG